MTQQTKQQLRNTRDLLIVVCMVLSVLYGPTCVMRLWASPVPPKSTVMVPMEVKQQSLLKARPSRGSTRAIDQPPLALCFPIQKVSDVHDGDTCKVIVAMELTVRYDNCWAPELKEPKGPESAKRAKEAIGKAGRLYIDLTDVHNLADALTFGRVVGEIFLNGEQESESAKQVRLGLASTTKGGPLGK